MIERAGLTGGRCHNKLMPQFNKTLDCWDISEKSPLKHLFGMKLIIHPFTPDLWPSLEDLFRKNALLSLLVHVLADRQRLSHEHARKTRRRFEKSSSVDFSSSADVTARFLYMVDRLTIPLFAAGIIDLVFGLLFVVACCLTPSEYRPGVPQ